MKGAGLAADAQSQGASVLQSASQIPYANLANLYGISGAVGSVGPDGQVQQPLAAVLGHGKFAERVAQPGIHGRRRRVAQHRRRILGNMNFAATCRRGPPSRWMTRCGALER